MTAPWFLPSQFLQEATVLLGPDDWVEQIDVLAIDIVPRVMLQRVDYTFPPFDAESAFSHLGYVGDLGPIDQNNPGRWRLRQSGRDFKINRVQDWDGFYVMELDEVHGG